MYEFAYNSKSSYLDNLELEDIYNVALEAIDSDGLLYYLCIKSSNGMSSILEYGPIEIDSDKLPYNSTIKYSKIKSKTKNLINIITKFLSSKKRLYSTKVNYEERKNSSNTAKIIEVTQLDFNDALSRGVDLFNYMKKDEQE